MTANIRKRIEAMSMSATGTIRQAMRSIERGALGVALLIEPRTKHFVGLVTDGDIRRALLKGYGLKSPVTTVQRLVPKTARAGMSLQQVSALFSEPVGVVPLLDEDGRVADLAVFNRRGYIPVAEPSLGEKELLNVLECVLTGWVSSAGKFITRFEEMFAEFCGTRYAIATSNGTTALHLALLALGIGPGDEVIVPTLTFISTASAVSHTGARAVFVDSELETWNIDPNLIEEAITSRTKAIIPVHLYGHPASMSPILDIAARHNLAVIEDAAEAHGACYKGQRVGGIGDMGAFSFYGNKIITTGEGGMVVTNRADLSEKIRLLRNHGMSPEHRYWHLELGYNYRMTNLQAALGVAQLEKVQTLLAKRRRLFEIYNGKLGSIPGVTLPPSAPWADSVCWLYTILIDKTVFGMSRDALMESLREENIETRPMFIPLHLQPLYRDGSSSRSFPNAEMLAHRGLSLPSSANLRVADVERVAEVISYLAKRDQTLEKPGKKAERGRP